MAGKTKEGAIERVISDLAREAEQEDALKKPGGSFFDGAPSAEVMIARAREYDDLPKHIVRKEHWLKVAKDLANKKKGALKLLTLPGRYRFEVELYRSEGLLGDQDLPLPVVGFETSPEVFGLLCTSGPQFEQLFYDDLVETLIDADARSHRELVKCFPFDIINLDLTVNLVTKSEGPYGPVLRAIRECFRLQASQEREWALMLTFRAIPEDTSADALALLEKQYQENIDRFPQFEKACYDRFGTTKAERIFEDDPEEALGQFAAKWIVDQAHAFEFKVVGMSHAVYRREVDMGQRKDYLICKLIFTFGRMNLPRYALPTKRVPETADHVEDLVRICRTRQVNVSEQLEKLRLTKPAYLEKLAAEIESLKFVD